VVESEFTIGEDAAALGRCFRNADKLSNIHYGEKNSLYLFIVNSIAGSWNR
jgi:hypothetical protein